MRNPDYQTPDGRVVMYRADCLEILREMPDGCVDAVVTDPPYHKWTHTKHFSSVTKGQPLGFAEIDETIMVNLVCKWSSVAKRWVIFTCDWRFATSIDATGLLVRFGVWRKSDGAPQFTGDRPGMGWEPVMCCHRQGKKRWNGGGKHAFWEYHRDRESIHPTGKPLGLYSALIGDFSDINEIILDPFMGSGTTGVACIQTGRKFIGVEKEPKYFDIAVARIETALDQAKQMPLFEDVPKPKQEALFDA